jgi:methylthioribulose-1-phosphate dehydratase
MSDATAITMAEELAAAAREFYRRGWVLGTSGNFSALAAREPRRIYITASGTEKGTLTPADFLELEAEGAIAGGRGKPSAETALHLAIYRLRRSAASVMHTHSVWGTILSDRHAATSVIEIEGFEMLKGLAGVTTHEHTESVPVIENSQDYTALSAEIDRVLNEQPEAHGIYLRRHGLYAWGSSISEAKRHIEIFEFLFEVLGRSMPHAQG